MGDLEQCKAAVDNADWKGKFEGKEDGLFSSAATKACQERAWQKGKDLLSTADMTLPRRDIAASLENGVPGQDSEKVAKLATYLKKISRN